MICTSPMVHIRERITALVSIIFWLNFKLVRVFQSICKLTGLSFLKVSQCAALRVCCVLFLVSRKNIHKGISAQETIYI